MKITEKIVEVDTQKETIVERELFGDELELYKNEEKKAKALIEAEAERTRQRKSAFDKLSALGLTADDLKALGLG